jgi:hypothetical protein
MLFGIVEADSLRASAPLARGGHGARRSGANACGSNQLRAGHIRGLISRGLIEAFLRQAAT